MKIRKIGQETVLLRATSTINHITNIGIKSKMSFSNYFKGKDFP